MDGVYLLQDDHSSVCLESLFYLLHTLLGNTLLEHLWQTRTN